MAATPVGGGAIFTHEAITVQQTKRGCYQEMCGCEAKSEYRVYPGHVEQGQPRAEGIPQIGHLLEDSGFLIRLCCADMRGFTMKLAAGDKPAGEPGAGPVQAVYEKPFSFPIFGKMYIPTDSDIIKVNFPCCCFLPSVDTKTPDGRKVGSSRYICDLHPFVPAFEVLDEPGRVMYYVRPDTCCCDQCITCNCCGGPGAGCIFTPFYIRDPITKQPVPSAFGPERPAEIRKVWSGFKKECCTDADNFHVIFPAGASEEVKMNLLGTNMLIDFSWFETQA
jgi:hypothetical protein